MRIVLTKRETEVVRLFGRLETYRDVADRLGCSPETVRTHANHIARRLPWPHLTPKDAVRHYAFTQRVNGTGI